jgi:hypothetical protein
VGVAAETVATWAEVLSPGVKERGKVRALLPTPFQMGLASVDRIFGMSRMKAWTL